MSTTKLQIVNKLSGMGGIVTGSYVLHLMGLWDNPNDVDVIFPSIQRESILARLLKMEYTYNDGSLLLKGDKVVDLIFVSKLPKKQRVVAGITCIDPNILIRIYQERLDDDERKDKRNADSEKIKAIQNYQKKHSLLLTENKENQSFLLNSGTKRKKRSSSPIPFSLIGADKNIDPPLNEEPRRKLFF